eukprot:283113_1
MIRTRNTIVNAWLQQSEEVRNAISLIEIYESESFARYLRYKELHDLRRAIDKIWRLDSIQTTFSLRDTEYHFPVNLDYFFDKINEIMMEDYTPTKEDALKCKMSVNMSKSCIVEHKYTYKQHGYKVIDGSALCNERRKWIHQFDTFDAILFVAALDNYNSVTSGDMLGNTRNAMHEALALFDEICNSKWLRKTETILFLNRDDLFREKLTQQISLSVCFSASVGWKGTEWEGPDYTPIVDYDYEDKQHYDECYAVAIDFIRTTFSEIKFVTCHVVSVTSNLNQVERIFWDVQNIVIRANLEKGGLV